MSDLLTKALTESIEEALEQGNKEQVREYLNELYPEDIAELSFTLSPEEMQTVLDLLERVETVKTLRALDEDERNKILKLYTPDHIAKEFVDNMDSDDAADMLNELPAALTEEVIALMTDEEQSKNVTSLLRYKDDTAGGLMAKELVAVNIDWTLAECVEEIRKQAEDVERVYSIYVVDSKNRLRGIVSLKNLILHPATVKVESIYNPDIQEVTTHTSGEEVAQIMNKYDLIALPVVDVLGRLMGRITIDDVVEFIKDEADKDYQLLSGISEDVELTDKVWILSRARLPWLLIGLLGGIASSRVVGLYEGELLIHPQMAFFMPLVAAMGGNAGVQSSAIVVQGLANNTMGTKDIMPKLGKEFLVALINGVICALIIFGYNYFIGSSQSLSVTVGSALLSVIIFASVLGMIVPLLLDKAKIDPALATGPFITTTNDLLGLGIYFTIGQMML
jgi:magnesium transporter